MHAFAEANVSARARSFRFVIPSHRNVSHPTTRTESQRISTPRVSRRLRSPSRHTDQRKNCSILARTLKTNCYRLIFVPRNSETKTAAWQHHRAVFGHTKDTDADVRTQIAADERHPAAQRVTGNVSSRFEHNAVCQCVSSARRKNSSTSISNICACPSSVPV